jgi:hypothetical protein
MCGCSGTPGTVVHTVIIRTAGKAAWYAYIPRAYVRIHPNIEKEQNGHTFQAVDNGAVVGCSFWCVNRTYKSHNVKWLADNRPIWSKES